MGFAPRELVRSASMGNTINIFYLLLAISILTVAQNQKNYMCHERHKNGSNLPIYIYIQLRYIFKSYRRKGKAATAAILLKGDCTSLPIFNIDFFAWLLIVRLLKIKCRLGWM